MLERTGFVYAITLIIVFMVKHQLILTKNERCYHKLTIRSNQSVHYFLLNSSISANSFDLIN